MLAKFYLICLYVRIFDEVSKSADSSTLKHTSHFQKFNPICPLSVPYFDRHAEKLVVNNRLHSAL